MSRIGKQPIKLPKGVEFNFKDKVVTVKGSKGTLTLNVLHKINMEVVNNEVIVSVDENSQNASAFHGLYRSLVNNMIIGTSQGFEKKMEMVGVGYRAAVKGNSLDLQLGFSHPTLLPIPAGLTVTVEKNTLITVAGTDKQKIGQFCANVRAFRPPEPYQGKGVRYLGEIIKKKAGKSASK